MLWIAQFKQTWAIHFIFNLPIEILLKRCFELASVFLILCQYNQSHFCSNCVKAGIFTSVLTLSLDCRNEDILMTHFNPFLSQIPWPIFHAHCWRTCIMIDEHYFHCTSSEYKLQMVEMVWLISYSSITFLRPFIPICKRNGVSEIS